MLKFVATPSASTTDNPQHPAADPEQMGPASSDNPDPVPVASSTTTSTDPQPSFFTFYICVLFNKYCLFIPHAVVYRSTYS